MTNRSLDLFTTFVLRASTPPIMHSIVAGPVGSEVGLPLIWNPSCVTLSKYFTSSDFNLLIANW